VIKEEGAGFSNKSIIVDGQQRLTSTLLFLIALRDTETDTEKKNFITQTYLTNSASTFQDKIKLKQVTKDWDGYKSLVNNQEPSPGVVTNAYNHFLKLINENKLTQPDIKLEHYVIAIQRMNVAVIFLDERPFKGEDPQIIFETLNSLGKPLTLSDLVRNFILLKMRSEEQSEIYETIWYPKIEGVLNENTSAFFRDYLQYKTASSVKVVSNNNTKEVYHLFKKFVENNFKKRIDFVNDIVCYANWYKWIITEKVNESVTNNVQNSNEIKELLRNIFHDIKSEAFKPFVLGLFDYYKNDTREFRLSDDILISTLKTIRTYLIRKRILGLTQGENKNIVQLSSRIEEIAKRDISMLQMLSNMFYKMRFPNDNEMKTELKSLNFYEGVKKYSKFILGKMEEHKTKVSVDFRDAKITIEHIMPQTLEKSWQTDLGGKYKEIHETYLHNIGNLILTEFNSEMGNKSFIDKKQKINTSSLSYRLCVTNKNTWSEDSIIEHRENMINWFLETFPLPDTYKEKSNWKSKTNDGSTFSPLNPDAGNIAEGNKPLQLHVQDKIIKVKSWQDVFIKFLKYIKDSEDLDFDFLLENQYELFRKEDAIIKGVVLEEKLDESIDLVNRYKTFSGKRWDQVKNLPNDELFVHINISASTCINRLINIMNKLYMDEDSVKIVLK